MNFFAIALLALIATVSARGATFANSGPSKMAVAFAIPEYAPEQHYERRRGEINERLNVQSSAQERRQNRGARSKSTGKKMEKLQQILSSKQSKYGLFLAV